MIPETPAEVRAVLAERGLSPRKRFGQHFLADANLRDAVVRDAGVKPGDLVIEVGPGLGMLTKGLLSAGAEVVAVEVDNGLCAFLDEAFSGETRFTLFAGDAIEKGEIHPEVLATARAKRGDRRLLLVSNLPYAIATPLFAALARLPDPPELAVAMVQKEVALRMTAAPGEDDYGPLSVLLRLRGEAVILRDVGGRVFAPPAPVKSAVVSFRPRAVDLARLEAADRVSRDVFLYRRKAVATALRTAGYDPARVAAALADLGIDPVRRPETLTPVEYLVLSDRLGSRPADGGDARPDAGRGAGSTPPEQE